MKNLLPLLSVFFITTCAPFATTYAQSEKSPPTFLFSIFNANTMLPGGGDLLITSSVLHPGFNVGAEMLLKERNNNQWIVNAKAGYFYHRYSQHAVQLFGEVGYRCLFAQKHFGAEARLGAGYLHVFPDLQVFEKNESGVYSEKSGFGRPQAMIALSLSPSYTFGEDAAKQLRVFIDYQLMIQTPFVKNYVPILPYTILHVGVAKKFHTTSKN